MAPHAWHTSSGGWMSVEHDAHSCTASAPDVNQGRFASVSSGTPQLAGSAPTSDLPEEHGTARRVAGPRHRHAQLDSRDLARRLASHLAHGLDDVAEAVDVRLAEVPAARVDRQAAVGPLEIAVGHEVVELARLAEPHLAERHE